jgi:gliding motility-associated-like protein
MMIPNKPKLRQIAMSLALFFACLSVSAQLQVPVLQGNTSVCLASSAVLTATEASNDPNVTFKWYSDPLLGADVLIETTDTITLGPLLLSGNYKVSAYNTVTATEGPKLSFSITVDLLSTNVDVPVALPSDLIVCFGASTDVTATSPLGYTTFRWYDALADGDLLFEGNPYNTGPLTVLPSLYVTSVSAGGCESPRVLVPSLALIPSLSLPVPVAQNPIVCNNDESVAYVSNKPAGTTVNWYDALLGGNLLYTGDTLKRNEANTGLINLVSTYYAEIEDANGCLSLRAPVVITKLPALDVPLVNPPLAAICSGDSVEFTASSLLGGVIFHWYDALSGGNLLHTGATFNTGPIVNSGAVDLLETYYVGIEDGNGCESIRIPVVVTTLPALDVPLVDPLVATACANDSVLFTASALLGGTDFYWYDAIVGGNLLDSGKTFNTGPVANNSTANLTSIYYVETVDGNGCKSLRTPATVVSLPLLDVPIVTPIAPIICSGDSVEFTASALLGSTNFYWYPDLIGGSPIDSGATFNTGSIDNSGAVNLTKIYYVEAVDANGCTSLRIPVSVILKPGLDVPLVNPLISTICNGQSVDLAANALLGSTTFNWYDQLLGGNLLHTGDTFSTPNITNNTGLNLVKLYYLEAVDNFGCKSIRTPATVITRPALDLPIVSPLIATVCEGQSAEFVASSLLGDSDFRWYDAVLAGNLVHQGDTFNTGAISNNTGADLILTYSVEAIDDSGCVSLRLPATVIVRPSLDLPLASPLTQLICNGDSAEYTATTLLGSGVDFFWYDVPLGGSPIDSGATFNTGAINNSSAIDLARIFYVESVDSVGCRSLRTPVTLVIRPALDLPLVLPPLATVCNGDSVEFTATAILGGNGTFNWYDDLLAGNLLGTGDTYNTGAINNQGVDNLINTYFVEYVDSAGCKSIRTPAIAIVRPALDIPLANPPLAVVCNGDSAEFVGVSLLGTGSEFRWYDQLFGGNLLATGDTFKTPAIVNTSGLDLATIYYLESVDSAGCSSIRTPVTSIVRPALDLAIANPITQLICNGDSAEITAVALSSLLGGAAEFNWYDDLLAGNLLHSGDTFNTGAIYNESTIDLARIYYVEVTDTAGCKSLRTPATVLIRPALDLPLVTPPLAIACSGDSVDFSASSLLGSAKTFRWYDALLGGTELGEGADFNTGAIVNNGATDVANIYYVELEDTTGCRSIRVPVTVLSIPAIDVPLVTPPLAVICSGDSTEFVASSLLGSAKSFKWYDALVGGVLLHEGETFSTGPIVNASGLDLTKLYYVELTDTNGCTSVRVPAAILVRPSLLPPLPIPLSIICSGNSVDLTATKLLGGQLNWYEDLTSTTPLFTGDTFTTDILYNTGLDGILHDFYVELEDTSGCVSLRIPIEVLVTPGPSQPNVDDTEKGVCNGGDAFFFASSSNILSLQSFEWYNVTDSSTVISSSDSLLLFNRTNGTTNVVNENYFVIAKDSIGCVSPRTYVILQVIPDFSIPSVDTASLVVCSGEFAEFIADTTSIEGFYQWYSDTTIAPIFVGDTFKVGGITNESSIDEFYTYYVNFSSEFGCSSGFTKVVLEVNSTLDDPELEASADSTCAGNTVILAAIDVPVGYTVSWFTSDDLINPFDVGESIVSPVLTSDSEFSAKITSPEGCESSMASITIKVIAGGNLLDAPVVSCETLNDDSIRFTWTPVTNAEGYEFSLDAGVTWQTQANVLFYEYIVVKANNASGATMIVRAYQATTCGTATGPQSEPASCTFGVIDPENPIGVIFNSFSPNGDNSNDNWYLADGIELFPNNTVKIFNRWGQSVYETVGYNNADNSFTGENLEDGAYFYILEIPSMNFKKTGYVMIIR